MNKKKKHLYPLVIGLLFVAGVLFSMLFPFDNRNLTYTFYNGRHVAAKIVKTNGELVQEGADTFLLPEGGLTYTDVKVSAPLVRLAEMTASEFDAKVQSVDGGTLSEENGTATLTGTAFVVTPDYLKTMQNTSASRLDERVMLAEVFGLVCAFLLIVCSVIAQRKETNNNHAVLNEAKRFVNDIKKYRVYIMYSAKTDLKAEVADSYLNRLWWLLEPFFNMLVYVIVFGNIMGQSIENYALFVFSALLMWNFFSRIVNYSVKLVRSNRDIVTKVYIPKFVLLLSNMFLNLYKLLFSLIVLVAMMVIFRVQLGFGSLWLFVAYLTLIVFAFGVGMIFLHFGVFVDDLSYAVGILLSMAMFLSGVFYNINTTLGTPFRELMLYCNPAAICIDSMRQALLYNTVANVPQICIWLLFSLLLCAVGVHIVYKNENGYVKVV